MRYPLPQEIGSIIYKIAETKEELYLAKRMHHDIYLQKNYIKKPYPGKVIEDEYVLHSDYIIGVYINSSNPNSAMGEVVGVMRIIKNSIESFPAIKNFNLCSDFKKRMEVMDLNKVTELSALAVKGNFSAAKGLYRFAILYSDLRGDTHWLVVLDPRLARIYEKRFYFFFEQIGESSNYMGEITIPYIMSRKFQKEMMKREAPELAEFYYSEKLNPNTIDIIDLV